MREDTLNKHLTVLKPKHQEYIVHCVRDHGDMPDFHRGVLPFLSTQTAVTCLRIRLERVKEGSLTDPDEPKVGVRFIRSLLSKFGTSCYIAEGEVSVIMHLADTSLGRYFVGRYGPSFIVAIDSWRKDNAVHLKKLGKNKWLVTAPSDKLLDKATTFLGESFNI